MVDPRSTSDLEKRESPRTHWLDSDVQVMITSSDAKSRAFGWIQDISQGGFRLKIDTPLTPTGFFQKRDEIRFETSENFFHLKGKGKILWTSPGENTAGIRIDQLDEESQKYLLGFLGLLPLG